MVDDAHALGVFGQQGKGMIEHCGLHGKIDIVMGSMSKALGSIGGFIAGDRSLIDFLKNKARSFIYTTALPPAACAASLAALELIQENPSLREKLWDNITYLKSRLSQYKNAPAVHSPIIPWLSARRKRRSVYRKNCIRITFLFRQFAPHGARRHKPITHLSDGNPYGKRHR